MELHGRKLIVSDVGRVSLDNVLQVLNDTQTDQLMNARAEQYLWDYYRGKQEIEKKTKTTRPEINHRICENRCLAITDFKTGYLVGDPVVYTSRSASTEGSNTVKNLNDMMTVEDKASQDKEIVDWMHITGHGYRMVLPDDNPVEGAPFRLITLPPMNAYVIYSNRADHRPLAGVYFVVDRNGNRIYSVYTDTEYFEVRDGKITDYRVNGVGMIPIIEYPLNEARIGAFEPVISLLDAINYLDSDRLDGVTGFVNSLCVIYNAELPEGETGNSIRERGLITLQSSGDNRADIKILSEQLDQTSTQTLKNDLYQSVLQIVGMPNQSDGNTSDSSNNGAMFLKQGYQLAETRAKDTELVFKRSERRMLKLVAQICNALAGTNIDLADIDITFTRRAYSDINSKSTVLTTLLSNDKVAPIDAWTLSGISPTPEDACKRGLDWKEENKQEVIVNNDTNDTSDGRDKPPEGTADLAAGG